MERHNSLRAASFKYEELVYSIFCVGIAVTLVFWPLANSILCLVFAAYWLLFSRNDFLAPVTRKYWILLFCSLYLVVIIGAFHSVDTREAIFKLQQKSAYILFPIILGSSTIVNKVIYKRTFSAFVLSTLAACIFCLIKGLYQYFKAGGQHHLYGYELVEPLKTMTPFVLGTFCLLSLLFIGNNIYQLNIRNSILEKQMRKALPGIITIVFLFSFLLILGNRNILTAAGLVLIFYCLKFLKQVIYRIVAIVSLFVLFAIAININPFLNRQWNELFDFSGKNSIQLDQDMSLGRSWGGWQLRVAIWKCSWDVFKNTPVFGVGTGDVKESLQAAYENRKFYFASRYNKYNTHSQYLQESVANGLFGLVVFLSCLIVPLFFSNMNADDKEFYSLFLFCFAFVCLTDTPLELNKGIILYTFFNALIFFKSYNFKHKIINGKTAK